ncbi:hypothetical protein CK203_093632 [Vitis vinifera]|uniref:CCHC-type domain-containing protein n=1 Tax=Vitis vinifera TaxID=29760 RepID=A0A438CIB6_VITVI|nr:hypothetical protein CK203_093632 [Vitis vinifera]
MLEEEKPSEEDDDLALITRKLNKYMRGERFRGKKFTSRRNPSRRESSSHGDKEKWEEKGDLICFKCKKPGHIKYDCPLYKIEAKRRMKKAMMATWSESEESSEEEKEKEVANMCFMAIDDLDEGSKEDKWFLDSGCSRHMTGDESKFAFLTKRKGGYVTFGDNAKGRIIGQDNLGKFDAKSDVGIFLGYSTSSKAFRVFNKRTMVVEESIHVIFDESNNSLQERESVDDDLGLETSMGKLQIEDKRQQEESGEDPKKEDSPLALPPPQQVQGESSQDLPKDWKFVINHPQDQIIGNPSSGHDGELNYFLGLQIKQLKEGTFINQAKYIKDLLKRFNMEEAKVMKTPMSSSIKLDMDEKGHSLVSWHSKKQNSVALSTAEAEYIAAGGRPVEEPVDRFVGAGSLKGPARQFFSLFSGIPRRPFIFPPSEISLGYSLDRFQVLECSLTRFEARVSSLDGFGTSDLDGFLSVCAPSSVFSFPACLGLLGGKRPAEPSQQPEQTEARRKARYDTALFGSVEDYQRYKTHFAKRKVVPGRNINFFQLQSLGFEGLFTRMGWLPVVTVYEPIFPTLVRAFYSRMTYGLGGPIRTTVRGVEIELSPESICRILDVPPLVFEYMRPRHGLLSPGSSLERPFRGCADLQMPMGWANLQHIA